MSEIIAATGHRPPKLGGYGRLAEARLIALATAYLSRTRPTKTISGMALGWDMAFATASLALDIPFIAAVPFKGQESMWPTETQRQYNNFLARAIAVHVISPGGYSPAAMQVRNQWMVDHATRVVALWDGSAGGTANCMRYVERVGRPFDNLWDEWIALDVSTLPRHPD